MATTSRTRRNATPATDAGQPPAAAAQAPAVAPAKPKAAPKAAPQAAAKPAATKTVAKAAAKPAAKAEAKPAAKTARKTAAKTAAKPVAPSPDQPAAKPAAKPAARPAKAAAPAAAPVTPVTPVTPAVAPAAAQAPARKPRRAAAATTTDAPAPAAVPAAAAATAPAQPAAEAAAPAAPARKTPAKAAPAKPGAAKKAASKKVAPEKVAPKKAPAVAEAVATAPAEPPVAPAPAPAPAAAAAPSAEAAAPRRPKSKARPAAEPAAPVAAPVAAPAPAAPADDTAQAVLAVLAAAPADAVEAPAAEPAPRAERPAQRPPRNEPRNEPRGESRHQPRNEQRQDQRKPPRHEPRPDNRPAPRAEPRPAAPAEPLTSALPTGPAHSEVVLVEGDQRFLAWHPGHTCPPALRQAAQQRLDDAGHLDPADDAALPTLLRIATDTGHALRVDEAVWAHLAAHRDARTRLAVLELAYPDGPASAELQTLLRAPLPPFQAEGALFAVVAGRALLADERGLGKGVQAIAAATLWRRHFGVRRVLVLCAPAQRAVWQRAWQRFAPDADAATVQLMSGGLHHRQSLWSGDAGVRILSPEALASDAAHIAHWGPDLVIVDEPQGLGLDDAAWPVLAAPHALVLCGAPLADQPALMQQLVAWLDAERQGPLAALHELQAAADTGRALGDDDIERLTAGLSRLMLQRLRADLADQLPPLVHSERLVALAPGQRQAHDQPLALARRLLDGWRHSGYLSDSDQWRLALALRAMQNACHRADPADAASALADASVQALLAQRDEWAATGPVRAAVLCASDADQAQLAQRLAEVPVTGVDLVLVGPADSLPGGLDAVLQFGVPWRPRRSPAGPRGEAVPGQQWVYLVAQDSLDAGLFDTLAGRLDAPRGLADGGGRSYLAGERLTDWLQALQAAVQAVPAAAPDA